MPARSTADELLNALVGKPQQLTRIADAKMELIHESSRRLPCGCLRFLTPLLRRLSSAAASPNGVSRLGRKTDLFHELHGLRVLDPQPESLSNAPTGLLQSATVRLTSPNAWDPGDPCAALVPLEDHPV